MNQYQRLLGSGAALLLLLAAPGAVPAPAPPPWEDRDLGAPGLAGSTEGPDPAGIWTLRGGGRFLGNRSDNLRLTFQRLTGDATLTGRFRTGTGGHPEWSKVGLMVRANDTPGAPNVFLAMTSAQGLIALTRQEQNGETDYLRPVGPSLARITNLVMRLQRAAGEIAGFYGRDGSLWFEAGFPPQRLPSLSAEALFGLAVTSMQEDSLTTGRLDQVDLQRAATMVYGLGACGAAGAVTVQWRPLPGALAYNIYRGPATATARDQLALVNTERVVGTLFTDRSAGLTNGTTQTYAVAALFPGADGRPVEGPPTAIKAAPVAAAGFVGCDINAGSRPGGADVNPVTGAITVRGSGVLTFDNNDGLYFLNSPAAGDFQLTVKALAKPSGSSDRSMAGLMARESLEPDARYLALWVTAIGRVIVQWRTVTGGYSDSPAPPAIDSSALNLPVTLRITRRGNSFVLEISTDGEKTFRAAGPTVTLAASVSSSMAAGLAITAGSRGATSQARFADLELRSLP